MIVLISAEDVQFFSASGFVSPPCKRAKRSKESFEAFSDSGALTEIPLKDIKSESFPLSNDSPVSLLQNEMKTPQSRRKMTLRNNSSGKTQSTLLSPISEFFFFLSHK